MWTYSQKSGLISWNGIWEGNGYSGYGLGLNNGALEAEANVGPIPRGRWKIVRWDEVHAAKGPIVAVLSPVLHDAHGRSGFLIHGPHANDAHDSSNGCVIADKNIRSKWRLSKDMDMEVIA